MSVVSIKAQEQEISKGREVTITLLVTVPPNTPEDAVIYIAGNHEKLGNWSPNTVALNKVAPYQYQIAFAIRTGFNLQFKFTRGDWKSVEKDAEFYEIPNHSIAVKKGHVANFKVESWSDMGQPKKPKGHTWAGNIQEHKDFLAKKLNNRRTIWVYLPPDYDKSKKQYPVLYAHDGNNVFDCATAFLGVEWGLDDTAEKLVKEGKIRDIIIVAIENTSQRHDEYTQVYMKHHGGGKADLYADFIINDLKPFIDENYRTLKDRQYTGIIGSSLGGLVSLYIAWKHSDVFSMAAVVSPSVWWGQRDILSIINETTEKPPIKIWLDIGTSEGLRGDEEEGFISYAVRDTRLLRDALLDKGFKQHYDLEYLEVEGAEHNEQAWAQRVDKILLYFFGAKTSNNSMFRRFFRF